MHKGKKVERYVLGSGLLKVIGVMNVSFYGGTDSKGNADVVEIKEAVANATVECMHSGLVQIREAELERGDGGRDAPAAGCATKVGEWKLLRMTRVVVSEQAMRAELRKMQRQLERQVELCAGSVAQLKQQLAATERRVRALQQEGRRAADMRRTRSWCAQLLAGALGGVAALLATHAARR